MDIVLVGLVVVLIAVLFVIYQLNHKKSHHYTNHKNTASSKAQVSHLPEAFNNQVQSDVLGQQRLMKPDPLPALDNFVLPSPETLAISQKQAIANMAENLKKPDNFTTSMHLLNTPEACIDYLSTNPSATSKVLKMANSPFLYKPNKISNTAHATTYLGFLNVKNIILRDSINASFAPETEQQGIIYEKYWSCALIASFLCKHFGKTFNIQDIDTLSNQALLNFIGAQAMLASMPELGEQFASRPSFFERLAFENQAYGITESLVAERLYFVWELPDSYSKMAKLQTKIMLDHIPSDADYIKESLLIYTTSRLGEYLIYNQKENLFEVNFTDIPEFDRYYLEYQLHKYGMGNIESLLRDEGLNRDITTLIRSNADAPIEKSA